MSTVKRMKFLTVDETRRRINWQRCGVCSTNGGGISSNEEEYDENGKEVFGNISSANSHEDDE